MASRFRNIYSIAFGGEKNISKSGFVKGFSPIIDLMTVFEKFILSTIIKFNPVVWGEDNVR
jgi:hypothetical protein